MGPPAASAARSSSMSSGNTPRCHALLAATAWPKAHASRTGAVAGQRQNLCSQSSAEVPHLGHARTAVHLQAAACGSALQARTARRAAPLSTPATALQTGGWPLRPARIMPRARSALWRISRALRWTYDIAIVSLLRILDRSVLWQALFNFVEARRSEAQGR